MWKPYKFRLDKTKGYLENYFKGIYEATKGPNLFTTAMSIFNYIKNPIDTNVLFGNKNINNNYYLNIKKNGIKFNLYKYNNQIKKYLYDKYLKKGDNLLDLAGGRGGDLHKVKNSDYILHIDIVNKLLEEAKNRYNSMNTKPDINFLKFDLLGNNINKINKIKEKRNIDKFDVISCQFAFHYLCKSKETIDYIVKLINDNLKINGIFMMTGFDGKIIFDLLQDSNYIEYKYNNDIFSKIIKKYEDKTFKNYGQIINVYIEKIGIPQDEYLINFDYLTKQFNKYNISVIEENNFEEKLSVNFFDKKLSEEEINYIKLHKYIVYTKNK
jgi:mRNA (guanine-N7-)-methyltransferase